MSPKKITVVDASGSDSNELVGSQDGYKAVIADYGVRCLVDKDQRKARDFESLVDGGTYTLGPQQQQQQPPPPPTATIKLKYKNATVDWETDISEGNLTLVALTKAARRLFNIQVAKLEFVRNGNPINKDSDVTVLQDGALVRVENKQINFSSMKKIPQAMELVGFGSQSLQKNEGAFPQAAQLEDSDENVKHAIETINRLKSLVPIVGGCETTRRLYIDPILCAAGFKVGELTMTAEKTIEDAQFNGDVDYMFSFNDIVICVTEGKKDQLDYGIAQNIAQLSSVRANRKRKFDQIRKPATFGIATTFHEWVFIKYDDEHVYRTDSIIVDHERSTSITNVIRRIIGLLQKCKSDAHGEQPPGNRQKKGAV